MKLKSLEKILKPYITGLRVPDDYSQVVNKEDAFEAMEQAVEQAVKYTLQVVIKKAKIKNHPMALELSDEEIDKQSIISLEKQILKDIGL